MPRMFVAAMGIVATGVAGGGAYFVSQRAEVQERALVAPLASSTAPAVEAQSAARTGGVCFTGVQFVEGQADGCYSRAEFEAMRDRAVVGADGAAIAMEMAHPTDMDAPPALVSSCVEYDMRVRAGWYPLSNAELRREEFFRRACPVLKMAAGASPAAASHFGGGRLTAADAAGLASHQAFGFAAPPTQAEAAGAYAWNIVEGARTARILEVSHADFDGDGVGDILVFVSMRTENGAGRAMTGLAVKTAADAIPAFRPAS